LVLSEGKELLELEGKNPTHSTTYILLREFKNKYIYRSHGAAIGTYDDPSHDAKLRTLLAAAAKPMLL
jgi:hypothetical protein